MNGIEPGWLERQLKSVEDEVASWPAWMRREAGISNDLPPNPEERAVTDALRSISNKRSDS